MSHNLYLLPLLAFKVNFYRYTAAMYATMLLLLDYGSRLSVVIMHIDNATVGAVHV
jgi:hypothetical protein